MVKEEALEKMSKRQRRYKSERRGGGGAALCISPGGGKRHTHHQDGVRSQLQAPHNAAHLYLDWLRIKTTYSSLFVFFISANAGRKSSFGLCSLFCSLPLFGSFFPLYLPDACCFPLFFTRRRQQQQAFSPSLFFFSFFF